MDKFCPWFTFQSFIQLVSTDNMCIHPSIYSGVPICSGNGWVPWGNKPLPVQMGTQICVVVYTVARPQWVKHMVNQSLYHMHEFFMYNSIFGKDWQKKS